MKKILLISSLFLGGAAMSQTYVSTTPENKNVVLEEFTGIHCTYCPDGHKKAQQLKDNNPGDVILVNVHTGGYATPGNGEPDFRTSFGSGLGNQSDLTGYPAGTVNRKVFSSYAMDGGTAMGRSSWQAAGATILTEPSYVNVAGEATLDVQNRELTVEVEYYYTGASPQSTNKLNVALLQNNVEGPQTGAESFYPANILPNGNYNHQHMLRHFLTGQWGDDITTTTMGSSSLETYTYTIPADLNGVDFNLGNLEVVAYIAEGQQNIISGAEIPLTLTNFANQLDGELVSGSDVPKLCSGAPATITPSIQVTNDGEDDITSLTIESSANGGTVATTTGQVQSRMVKLRSLILILLLLTFKRQTLTMLKLQL